MSSEDDDNNNNIRRFNVHHRIMISAIFSLLAVMMIIISIHFYLKYLQKRRRESITRLAGIESSAQQNITRADRDDHAAEPPKTGLDQLLIAKVLPQSIHKQADHHGEVIECSICLSNIEDETIVRLLPNCKHIFHVECIDMWLHSNITCPVCRTAAEPIVHTAENDDLRPAVQPTAPPQPSSRLSSFRRVSLGRESSQPVQPTAPPMMDEQPSSRMSSFRRMLSRERSLRVQSCGDGLVGSSDIERH